MTDGAREVAAVADRIASVRRIVGADPPPTKIDVTVAQPPAAGYRQEAATSEVAEIRVRRGLIEGGIDVAVALALLGVGGFFFTVASAGALAAFAASAMIDGALAFGVVLVGALLFASGGRVAGTCAARAIVEQHVKVDGSDVHVGDRVVHDVVRLVKRNGWGAYDLEIHGRDGTLALRGLDQAEVAAVRTLLVAALDLDRNGASTETPSGGVVPRVRAPEVDEPEAVVEAEDVVATVREPEGRSKSRAR